MKQSDLDMERRITALEEAAFNREQTEVPEPKPDRFPGDTGETGPGVSDGVGGE